jgi:hypothetical protein
MLLGMKADSDRLACVFAVIQNSHDRCCGYLFLSFEGWEFLSKVDCSCPVPEFDVFTCPGSLLSCVARACVGFEEIVEKRGEKEKERERKTSKQDRKESEKGKIEAWTSKGL